MFFDKLKPASELLVAATKKAGLQMDRGKLVGSPEWLNIFTIEVLSRRSLPRHSPLHPHGRATPPDISLWATPRGSMSRWLLHAEPLRVARQGDVLRLDLEIEAHLGSTLQPSDTIILEKGNRISDDRLRAIQAAVGR